MNSTRSQQSNRLRKVILWLLLLALLCGFGLWLSAQGHGIPCPFYAITGLQCPGCGITRMLLALLQGDLSAAFHHNAAVLLLIPAGIVCTAWYCIRFIRTGSRKLSRTEQRIACAAVVMLAAFGVLRNIAHFF